MSVVYSLEEGIVKQTVSIPEKIEVKDLGDKSILLEKLEAEKISYQNLIDSHVQMVAEVQTKIDAINALE